MVWKRASTILISGKRVAVMPKRWTIMLSLVLLLAACSDLRSSPVAAPQSSPSPETQSSLSEEALLDEVWKALEPNTSSHERVNWDVISIVQISGEQVAEQFAGEPAAGCWSGPEVPDNKPIDPAGRYWYVQMTPRSATPEAPWGTSSPTAPPLIPEPFLRQAHFLVDAQSGEIVARRLVCVVY